MEVYCITFPDGSNYVGATKHNGHQRAKNHLSKSKYLKYKTKIYEKFREYGHKYEVCTLFKSDCMEEIYESEKAYIALMKGSSLLNSSTGGKISSKGKTVRKETIEKRIQTQKNNSTEFKAFLRETNELLYQGRSMSECSRVIGCTVANISYALKRGQSENACFKSKFIFLKQGVDYSD